MILIGLFLAVFSFQADADFCRKLGDEKFLISPRVSAGNEIEVLSASECLVPNSSYSLIAPSGEPGVFHRWRRVRLEAMNSTDWYQKNRVEDFGVPLDLSYSKEAVHKVTVTFESPVFQDLRVVPYSPYARVVSSPSKDARLFDARPKWLQELFPLQAERMRCLKQNFFRSCAQVDVSEKRPLTFIQSAGTSKVAHEAAYSAFLAGFKNIQILRNPQLENRIPDYLPGGQIVGVGKPTGYVISAHQNADDVDLIVHFEQFVDFGKKLDWPPEHRLMQVGRRKSLSNRILQKRVTIAARGEYDWASYWLALSLIQHGAKDLKLLLQSD